MAQANDFALWASLGGQVDFNIHEMPLGREDVPPYAKADTSEDPTLEFTFSTSEVVNFSPIDLYSAFYRLLEGLAGRDVLVDVEIEFDGPFASTQAALDALQVRLSGG